jgi:N-acetylmuramoyl-L-alanine amidase
MAPRREDNNIIIILFFQVPLRKKQNNISTFRTLSFSIKILSLSDNISNKRSLSIGGKQMKAKRVVFSLLILLVLVLSSLVINTSSNAQTKPTLYWGSRGSNVTQLQQRLSNWGYYTGAIDGVYGASTYQAVINFQRKNGLPIDGIVGAQTWSALGLGSVVSKSPSYQPTKGVSVSDDTMLLARAIHAEAESEPYIGKVSVGAVLLNRVANSNFPQTLSGVVYQGSALESVANGRVNTQPNDDSVRAARDALNGWDPTYGCLYFWNPSKPVNAWIWTRSIIVTYGSHVFAK